MPKLNNNHLQMQVQALNPEKAKTLLVFLTGYCYANEHFWKGVNCGIKMLEKSGEVLPEKEAK